MDREQVMNLKDLAELCREADDEKLPLIREVKYLRAIAYGLLLLNKEYMSIVDVPDVCAHCGVNCEECCCTEITVELENEQDSVGGFNVPDVGRRGDRDKDIN